MIKSTLKEYVSRQNQVEGTTDSKALLIHEYKSEIEETQANLLRCM